MQSSEGSAHQVEGTASAKVFRLEEGPMWRPTGRARGDQHSVVLRTVCRGILGETYTGAATTEKSMEVP